MFDKFFASLKINALGLANAKSIYWAEYTGYGQTIHVKDCYSLKDLKAACLQAVEERLDNIYNTISYEEMKFDVYVTDSAGDYIKVGCFDFSLSISFNGQKKPSLN